MAHDRPAGRAGLVILGVAASLLTAGCDFDEIGRPARFDKGVRLGGPNDPLSAQTRESLDRRVMLQRDAVALNQALSPAASPAVGAVTQIDGRIAGQNY